jgi:hypothetical protein
LTGKIYRLFHPSKQRWKRYVFWDGTTLVGRTNVGKVTVQALNTNKPSRVELREHLRMEGRLPPME